MAVNVKLGVDIGAFKSGIKDGQNILKGLNAEMKAADAEFKATGNAEKLMADKTKTLNSQLQVQKGIVDQAQKALKQMTDAGVDPADRAYQQLYATMMNAQAGMYETQAALAGLDVSAQQAATGASKLTDSVNGIGKKISLEQIISGIDTIKSGLESAAKKAVQLGEDLWNSIMNAAKWADDTQTMAQMYGIDVETFQRMQKLVVNGLDTSVEAMLKSQSKLKKGIGSDSKEVAEAFQEIGVSITESIGSGKYGNIEQARDSLELFWEAGQKIMQLGDENKQEDIAQKLFGRSWHELVPLFESYKTVEEYNEALKQTQINSAEDVEKLAELNDKVSELKGNFETLANDVMAQLAPALTDAATALNGVLTSILDYLKTEDGQKMLSKLGDAVSGLFGDLSKIDPEQAVSGFVDVFTKVTGGIQWLVDNAETAQGILGTIVAGWGLLTLGGGVMKIINLVDGIRGLTASSAAAAGATAGSSWAGAFASAAMKAAPFLAFLYTLLNPSAGGDSTGNNTLVDKEGNLTKEALEYGYELDENGDPYLTEAEAETWLTKLQTWFKAYSLRKEQESKKALQEMPEALSELMDSIQDAQFEENLRNMIDADMNKEPFDFVAEPQVPANAAAEISAQIGTVPVNIRIVGGAGGGKDWNTRTSRANGLPFVPYDGYLAELHKGERVVPAREMQSRNYSSNLYVESMIMNNGTDAEGLAAAMAAAQRRTMSGYGS